MVVLPHLVLLVLVAGCVAMAGFCKWSLIREARGQEIHAHSDGTVHEHFRGSVPHAHPTWAERHDAALARLFRDPA